MKVCQLWSERISSAIIKIWHFLFQSCWFWCCLWISCKETWVGWFTLPYQKKKKGKKPEYVETWSAIICFTDDSVGKSRYIKLSSQNVERPDLGNAHIVVTGGRGVKSAENFKMIDKLAEKIGAAGLRTPIIFLFFVQLLYSQSICLLWIHI